MRARLPESIDPFQLASRGERLEGTIAISAMARLAPSIQDNAGDIHVTLEFGLDEMRQPMVQGTLSGTLSMTCQRCLEPMAQEIDTRFLLGLVKNEYQMKRLSEEYEPLLVTDNSVSLTSMVEDEILLSLPIAPLHAPEHCSQAVVTQTAQNTNAESEDRPNPFAVLKNLKKT